MQQVELKEIISILKSGYIITSDGKDFFVLKNNRVHHYKDGTHYSLEIDEFLSLYKNNSFYIYEETVEIDDKKDEEYYRYYKK